MSDSEIPAKRRRLNDSVLKSDRNLLDRTNRSYAGKIENTPLHIAVINKNIELIETILSSGVDIDAPGEKNNTAIHLAVYMMNFPVIKCLLEHGANILALNKSDDRYVPWETPLHIAVKKNRLDIVKLLLTTQVDLNKLLKNNDTVLNLAFHYKYYKLSKFPVTQKLIDKGYNQALIDLMFGKSLNLNILNSDGHTPLSVAVQNQNVDMVKYLLDHGADINAKNYIESRYVWTALHIAVEINDANMVQFLLDYENCDIVAKTESNLTPLYIATYSNNLAIIKKLVGKITQHNVYSRNIINHVLPSFHEAVNRNKIKIAKYYLDTVKIDVNLKTEMGSSLLEIPAKFNNFQIFKLLVDYGAVIKYSLTDRYESGFDGDSPLYYAVKNTNVKMVDLILTRGVQINARDNKKANGVTILHLAVHSEFSHVVEKLLKCGANVNSKCGIHDYEEITPLLYAVFRKSYKIISLLFETEANLNDMAKINYKFKSIIDIAIEGNCNDIFFTKILNLGADINKSNIHNRKLAVHISNVLEEHLIKLKTAKLFVHSKFNSWVTRGMEKREFYDRCRREVKILKQKLISDSTICYYDLLIKNNVQVAMLANNIDTEKALELNELKAEFPLYAEILFCHFTRGQKRNQLLKKVEKILDFIFINLSRVCVQKILTYFSYEDLLWCVENITEKIVN